MTILLHDVEYILQIPIEGRLMSMSQERLDQTELSLCNLLGMNKAHLNSRSEAPGCATRGNWFSCRDGVQILAGARDSFHRGAGVHVDAVGVHSVSGQERRQGSIGGEPLFGSH
ncbi:unnamed protein product [Linum tenue]|uniref:Uncharacterized protein n=1 Tax=Linum tenue TaxID=586396 RepID=A0AAV0QT97_9ROSI|nr:unnamed protein product [Linum tenue]